MGCVYQHITITSYTHTCNFSICTIRQPSKPVLRTNPMRRQSRKSIVLTLQIGRHCPKSFALIPPVNRQGRVIFFSWTLRLWFQFFFWHVVQVLLFYLFLSLSFFSCQRIWSASSWSIIVCRTCRIQYDGRWLHCLLCLLHYNVVPRCRVFVTAELVSL